MAIRPVPPRLIRTLAQLDNKGLAHVQAIAEHILSLQARIHAVEEQIRSTQEEVRALVAEREALDTARAARQRPTPPWPRPVQ